MPIGTAIALVVGVIVFGCGIIAAVILQDRAYDRGWKARDSIGVANHEPPIAPEVPASEDPYVWDEYLPPKIDED